MGWCSCHGSKVAGDDLRPEAEGLTELLNVRVSWGRCCKWGGVEPRLKTWMGAWRWTLIRVWPFLWSGGWWDDSNDDRMVSVELQAKADILLTCLLLRPKEVTIRLIGEKRHRERSWLSHGSERGEKHRADCFLFHTIVRIQSTRYKIG